VQPLKVWEPLVQLTAPIPGAFDVGLGCGFSARWAATRPISISENFCRKRHTLAPANVSELCILGGALASWLDPWADGLSTVRRRVIV